MKRNKDEFAKIWELLEHAKKKDCDISILKTDLESLDSAITRYTDIIVGSIKGFKKKSDYAIDQLDGLLKKIETEIGKLSDDCKKDVSRIYKDVTDLVDTVKASATHVEQVIDKYQKNKSLLKKG